MTPQMNRRSGVSTRAGSIFNPPNGAAISTPLQRGTWTCPVLKLGLAAGTGTTPGVGRRVGLEEYYTV